MGVKYNITEQQLREELFKWSVNNKLRFGEYLVNTFADKFDREVFYEPNNGTAYFMVLKKILKAKK